MTVSGIHYDVNAGDIMVVFPSHTHSYDEVSQDAYGLSLIFPPDSIMQFSRLFRTMTPEIPLLMQRCVTNEMNSVIHRMLEAPPEESMMIRLAYLHLFLACLFSQMTLVNRENGMQKGMASQVLIYIAEHFTDPLTLDNTAHALGISRIHLSHIFSQQLKLNFRQHINALRIEYACKLLQDPGQSVSQIAYLCGYTNARTFHRVFQSHCGVTPNQYRQRVAEQRFTDAI